MNAKFVAFVMASFIVMLGAASAFAAHEGCARLCQDCSSLCTKTLGYLQQKGGKYAESDRINTMKDCVKLCDTNADLKRRHSPNDAEVDKACAAVCSKCAEKCEQLNDPKLKDCIALCKKCASSCEKTEK